MKKLLLITALLIGLSVNGQTLGLGPVTPLFTPPFTITMSDSMGIIRLPQDTIPVLMLVCDSTNSDTGSVWWMRGYEIVEIVTDPECLSLGHKGTWEYQQSNRHVAYLDSKKKPVKHTLWLTKGIDK